jgi:hypothetical protein
MTKWRDLVEDDSTRKNAPRELWAARKFAEDLETGLLLLE